MFSGVYFTLFITFIILLYLLFYIIYHLFTYIIRGVARGCVSPEKPTGKRLRAELPGGTEKSYE